MLFSSKIMSVLRPLFRKQQMEDDLSDEVRAYVDELTARKIRAGEDPESARRHALVESGGIEQIKEECRDVRRMSWFDVMAQDVRYGLRTMRRYPAVTLVALLSLGVGIGVNTLIFSLIDAMILNPLPYSEPGRLVIVEATPPETARDGQSSLTYMDCATFSDSSVFEEFGCYTDSISMSIAEDHTGTLPPDRLLGQPLSASLARTFGIAPLLGRWFTEEEEREDPGRVIVIGYGVWQRRFGGARDIIGKTTRLDGRIATIIGVMPDEFQSLDTRAEYWMPLRDIGNRIRSSARMFRGVGRLRTGMDLQRVQSEVDAYALSVGESSPETNKGWGMRLRPLQGALRGLDSGDFWALLALQGTVAFVLLLACANVAGLLLAQGAAQHRELSVRAALGAGRWRIVRQLMTHGILLSFSGAILGAAIGAAGLEVVQNALPPGRAPRAVYETRLDATVLAFTFGTAFLCGLLVGLAPAIHISRAEPIDVLREASRSATAGVARQKLRSAFVIGQVAVAFVLLIGAGITLKSLMQMAGVALGFDPDNLVTVQLELPEAEFRVPTGNVLASGALAVALDPAAQFAGEQLRQNLASIPGVSSAGAIAICPPLTCAINQPVRIEAIPLQRQQTAQFIPVMPDYFATLDVDVIQGREFGPQDTPSSLPVALINEALAREFPSGRNPLGEYIQIDSPVMPNQPPLQIVGVVPEIPQYGGQQDRWQLYLPFSQLPRTYDERLAGQLRGVTYILRTSRPAAELASAVATAVRLVDETQAISSIRTMQQTAFDRPVRRIWAGMLGAFGIAALILATIGIYGLMAHLVTQRTNELGIRLALGARPTEVRRLVVRHGGRLIGIGLLAGLAGAFALAGVLGATMNGVSRADPLTLALGVALLGGIGLLACYIPARRASRIDPIAALRHD